MNKVRVLKNAKQHMSDLEWSPLYNALEKRIQLGDQLIFVVAPFIKITALTKLLSIQNLPLPDIKVICRWRADDILSGSSDLEIYPYLNKLKCQLYLNPHIHLKLYVFESNLAFNTSANLTLRGLGYMTESNIEIGNFLELGPEDWSQLYQVIQGSRLVDDEIYDRYKAFVDQSPAINIPRSFPIPQTSPKKFTISALPATVTPSSLANFYFSSDKNKFTPEEIRRAAHDLILFKIAKDLNQDDFHLKVGAAFRSTDFVNDFVQYLQMRGSLRFGEANNWIYEKCDDVPLPYRWEIKENTRILYNWLAQYFSNITWHRPNYSQVIWWCNE